MFKQKTMELGEQSWGSCILCPLSYLLSPCFAKQCSPGVCMWDFHMFITSSRVEKLSVAVELRLFMAGSPNVLPTGVGSRVQPQGQGSWSLHLEGLLIHLTFLYWFPHQICGFQSQVCQAPHLPGHSLGCSISVCVGVFKSGLFAHSLAAAPASTHPKGPRRSVCPKKESRKTWGKIRVFFFFPQFFRYV